MSELAPEPFEVHFVQWLEQLRVDVAESIGGVVLRGARPVPFRVSGTGNRARITTARGAIVGLNVRSADLGEEVDFTLFDGDHDDAPPVYHGLAPAAPSLLSEWWGPGGIHVGNGLTLTVGPFNTGLVGVIYLRGVE